MRQLFPSEFEKNEQTLTSFTLNGCEIKDYPRFKWRGLHLDVSRHFFTVDEVKAFIDKMSQYKFNVFHWHLTDDEGWRIEIKSLPKLTEVGAWRVERYGDFGKERPYPKPGEKATYGGFYSGFAFKPEITQQIAVATSSSCIPNVVLNVNTLTSFDSFQWFFRHL